MRALALALAFGLITTAFPTATIDPPTETNAAVDTATAPAPPAVRAEEVRALWVVRTSMTSRDQIARLVQDARDSGFNTLLVQVRGRGDSYFTNGLEPRPPALASADATFDPLAQAIAQGHAAGLRVHAWVNVNFVANVTAATPPLDATHVVRTHPEWLMVPRALAPELVRMNPRRPAYVARLAAWTRAHDKSVEGLYTSPILPEAARHLEAVVTDIVKRYPIDGLHLDYVRYPTSEFDYSAGALNAFRESVFKDLTAADRARLDARLRREPLIYTQQFPQRWTHFRRARLTDLVARLRSAVKQQRPQALFSAAVKPDAREAADHRLQDWQDWAARGLLDVICPMTYTTDEARFLLAVRGATQAAAPQVLWAGIGAYRLDSTQTIAHIQAARAAGAHGIAIFSYNSLTRPALRSIGRTAFREAAVRVASAPSAGAPAGPPTLAGAATRSVH